MIPRLLFTIEGPPVAKGRPRFNPEQPHRRPVTPKKTREFEKRVGQVAWGARLLWQQTHRREWPLGATYRVTVVCFTRNRVQPDLVNVRCSILDGAQKVLWSNDRQVKRSGPDDMQVDKARPRTEVTVEVVEL